MTKTRQDRSVLIVEDDVDVRDAIALTLSMENFQVQVADSREVALSILEVQSPSVIILDWFMPGMNVESFVAKVNEEHPNTTILMISASMKLEEKAKQLGLKYYLTKPFEVADLLSITQTCAMSS
jgi:DNA-binding response OmpR family regulator